jgi:hypothetical protein
LEAEHKEKNMPKDEKPLTGRERMSAVPTKKTRGNIVGNKPTEAMRKQLEGKMVSDGSNFVGTKPIKTWSNKLEL